MKCMSFWTIPLLLCAFLFPACLSPDRVSGTADDIQQVGYPAVRVLDDASQPLPNWATPSELLTRVQRGWPSASTAPPPSGQIRIPAEYEPTLSVVMTFAAYRSVLNEIATSIADAGVEVWAVAGPERIDGVPDHLYKAFDFAYNSVWSRDYGPVGIHPEENTLAIVDTTYRHYSYRQNDDAIPCQVAAYAGASCHTTELILDGGNLMTDGRGTAFMSKRTYDWNTHLSQAQVDQNLKDYLGVHTILTFDYAKRGDQPADGTGHIDMFAKLLAPCKVLVAEADDAPFRAVLEDAAQRFSNLVCDGSEQTYTVYRIPAWYAGGTWYTYTNSLIVNTTIIVPSYSGADNEQAKQIYQDALPGYHVVMINTDDPISSGGSIHCVTKEIPLVSANQAPISDAGADQQVDSGQLVTLDGSQSHDLDGDALSFAWNQLTGVDVVLDDSKKAQPAFFAPQTDKEIALLFVLIVNDGHQAGLPDQVEISVRPSAEQDEIPIDRDSYDDVAGQGCSTTGARCCFWLWLMVFVVFVRRR